VKRVRGLASVRANASRTQTYFRMAGMESEVVRRHDAFLGEGRRVGRPPGPGGVSSPGKRVEETYSIGGKRKSEGVGGTPWNEPGHSVIMVRIPVKVPKREKRRGLRKEKRNPLTGILSELRPRSKYGLTRLLGMGETRLLLVHRRSSKTRDLPSLRGGRESD